MIETNFDKYKKVKTAFMFYSQIDVVHDQSDTWGT